MGRPGPSGGQDRTVGAPGGRTLPAASDPRLLTGRGCGTAALTGSEERRRRWQRGARAPLHTGQASRLLGWGARAEESCVSKRPLPPAHCVASGGPLRFFNWSNWARCLPLPFQPQDSRTLLLLTLDTCVMANLPIQFLSDRSPNRPAAWLA